MTELLKTFQSISEKLAEHLPEDKKYIMNLVNEDLRQVFEPRIVKEFDTWKGVNLPVGYDAKTAKYAYDKVEFKENSIFVVTFAKSGTTWTMQIIRHMLYGHDKKLDEISKFLTPQLNYLEMGTALKHDAMINFPFPRVLYGSHLPEDLVNVERITKRKGKFIIVLRNPKDQAVSLYHFMQGPNFIRMRDRIPSDWAGFFDAYIQGKLPLVSREGEWLPDYILGWHKHKNDNNFLFLYFEDMKKDCDREIKKIAEFLQLDLSDERLKETGVLTNFSNMKKQNNEGFGKLLSEMNFLRKGKVGGWKDYFTVAQSELMDKLIEEKLGHTDIKFTYES